MLDVRGCLSDVFSSSLSLSAEVFENLHAMVVAVGDINRVVRRDGDAIGQAEFARAAAALPEVQQQLAVRRKNLHVVEHGVGDVEVAERIRRDALGPAKISGRVAAAAEL